ncbi:MAG TPA: DUF6174 domain-containing protein [Longimicrobium sp.]|nr:DUF6174 domain-containing protein [Longimicrobium sp.]
MRRPLRLTALLLSLSTAACARTAVPANEPAPAQSGAVAQARARWAGQGIDDYRYTFERMCFCLGRGPVRVEVRDGRVVSVTNPENGQPAPDVQPYIETVATLFDKLAEAERDGSLGEVAYDPTLGYPSEATIGNLAADAGISYRVRDLQPVR